MPCRRIVDALAVSGTIPTGEQQHERNLRCGDGRGQEFTPLGRGCRQGRGRPEGDPESCTGTRIAAAELRRQETRNVPIQ
jgi:hypothetical protein